jgi:23S rRNA (uracil1939-C5)-methyltransferase
MNDQALENAVELEIEAVGRHGDGVGFYQKRPVFVPRTLAGERVAARLGRDTSEGYQAQLLEVLTPSAHRVAPPCVYYAQCGGCKFQHMDEATYRAHKIDMVMGLLDKADIKAQKVLEPIFIGAGTRRRATFAAMRAGQDLRMGYHREKSHQIVDIESCLIVTDGLMASFMRMREGLGALLLDGKAVDVFLQDSGAGVDCLITGPIIRRSMAMEQQVVEFAKNAGLARLSWRETERDMPEIMASFHPIFKDMGSIEVKLPEAAFMQPSIEGETVLTEAVLAPFKKRKVKRIMDLFAGSGTFSGPLLTYGHVHAVDMDGPAMWALQEASKQNQKLTVEKRNLFTDEISPRELKNIDAVVFDPPRAGAQDQAKVLAKSNVPLVVAVSCNPVTFAKDAALLIAGGYTLKTLQIVDQFIWSSHCELIAVFNK